jgi:hypothetical protein
MKVVFEKGDKKLVADVGDYKVAQWFLDVNGGGMNEDQTARAMEDQRAVLEGETICVNGVDIYTID